MTAPMKDRAQNFKRIPICNHCVNLNKWNKDNGTNTEFSTNHWLRETPSPNSPIVCPQLLATVCRFCHKTGHTKSLCKALNQRKATDKREQKRDQNRDQNREMRDQNREEKRYAGRFELLEIFPEYVEPPSDKPSYKSVLQHEKDFPRSLSPSEPPPLASNASDFIPKVIIRRNWADEISDDDTSDDD